MTAPQARTRGQRLVERGLFLLSLLVVLGTVTALIMADRFWEPDRPALAPVVTSVNALPNGGTVIHFRLENTGQVSVEEVTVEVGFDGPGSDKVELVFPHLPRGARKEGVAVLQGAPSGAGARVHVRSYQVP